MQISLSYVHTDYINKINSYFGGRKGRAIAQAVSRCLPTAAVRDSKPDLGMWDLWWDKVALG
jgi:hypothetical protein